MCTKTEERIMIASKPFIKKAPARKVIGCGQKQINELWTRIVKKYEKENGPAPVYGLPTKYFLKESHISLEDLIQLNEYEKRFNA